MLAHGAVLRKNFFNLEEMLAIVGDFRQAGLAQGEVALMAFAQKVIRQANQVSQEDIAGLHVLGFSDAEILDIVVVVTARSFFSKTLDALGAEPDEIYAGLEPELIQALTIGRSFP